MNDYFQVSEALIFETMVFTIVGFVYQVGWIVAFAFGTSAIISGIISLFTKKRNGD